MLAACDAVAYAHSRGVVHRDIKPSNILIGAFGETLVIDWGLAGRGDSVASAEASGASDATLTQAGDVIGTPAYMAPEQARGEPCDERGDVYALGATLYHALSGTAPYTGHSSGSEVVEAVKQGPPAPLSAEVPPELRAIVARAMARAPADRYPQANAIADELRRFFAGKLVAAHAYSRVERLRRWVRRHRTTVVVASLLTTALIATAVVGVVRVMAARDRADAERARAVAARDDATRAAADAVARQHQLVLSNAAGALLRDPTASLAWLRQAPVTPATAEAYRRIAADALARGVARHVLAGHAQGVDGLAFVGGTLFTGARNGEVKRWVDGVARTLGEHPGLLLGVERAPGDGAVSWCSDGTLWLWAADGARRASIAAGAGVWNIAFAPDGATVYIADATPRIAAWRVSTGAVERVLTTDTDVVRALVRSPDGRWLVSASDDGRVRRFDLVNGGEVTLAAHAGGADRVELSDDGAWLASVGIDHRVLVWDVATWTRRELAGHTDEVFDVAFLGGRQLATVSGDRTVRVWNLDGGAPRQLLGHQAAVVSLAASPDGRWIATGDEAGGLRLWDVAAGEGHVLAGHRGEIRALDFSSDSRTLASGSEDGSVRVWTIAPFDLRTLTGPRWQVLAVAYSRDGARLVAADNNHDVWRFDLTGDDVAGTLVATGGSDYVTFLADDRTILAAGPAVVIAPPDGPGRELFPPGRGFYVPRHLPDGTLLLGSVDGTVGRLVGDQIEPVIHSPLFSDLMPLPGGALVTAGDDGVVRIWRAPGAEPEVLTGHTSRVFHIQVSPDGKTFSTASFDKTARLWDVATGRSTTLTGHTDYVFDAQFSPDGARVVTASRDGTARLWTVADGSSRALPHGESVGMARFTSDGAAVLTCAADGVLRTWSLDGALIEMRRLGVGCRPFALSPDGRSVAVPDDDHRVRIVPQIGAPLPVDDAALPAFVAQVTSAQLAAGDVPATP